jgi:hypothetical protein
MRYDPSDDYPLAVILVAAAVEFLTPTPLAIAHGALRAGIAVGLYAIGLYHAAYVVGVLAVFALAGSIERKVARGLALMTTGHRDHVE